jgi:hypothetical protein
METVRFLFWEAMKVIGLAFAGLVAAKAIATLRRGQAPNSSEDAGGANRVDSPAKVGLTKAGLTKTGLYVVLLALVALGAYSVGVDVAAEIYYWAAQDNLAKSDAAKAYINAVRSIELRPSALRHWRVLERAKFTSHQFASMIEDAPALQKVSGGELEEEDALRLAYAYFFTTQYDRVFPITERLLRQNRYYAAPSVLEGYTYIGKRQYHDAKRTFLFVLQVFPNQEDAVKGLAEAYFLGGERAQAVSVLRQTSRFNFTPDARRRLSELQQMYEADAVPEPPHVSPPGGR